MPSYFVVQPDGRLAQFSTVVDDFTALNMTDEEAVQMVVAEEAERAKLIALQGITRARLTAGRWEDCLHTVGEIHGPDVAAERQQQAKEPS